MKHFSKRLCVFLLLFTFGFALAACNSSGNGSDGGGGDGDELEGGDPSTENIDIPTALQLAYLCLQSYQMLDDFNNGQPFSLPAPYTLVKVFSTGEPFEGESPSSESVPIAFIATQGSTVFLVFRGTQTIVEWIDDAELDQVPYSFVSSGGLTEQGFTKVYATIRQDILATLTSLFQSGSASLLVTGHSLGAAMAVLAIPDVKANAAIADPAMVSFAGPRVGNPKFAETTYNGGDFTSWRVVNTNDLVPTLPKPVTVVFHNNQPKTLFYEHVATEFDITFGNPVSGPTDIADIEFNHAMCHYYETLCQQAQDPTACLALANGVGGCTF